jgi:hypothetical protein
MTPSVHGVAAEKQAPMTSDRLPPRASRARSHGFGARAVAAVAACGGLCLVAACDSSGSAGGQPTATPSPMPESSIAEAAGPQSLQAGLLGPDVLAVPPDWAVRDLDNTITEDAEAFADTDPFLGLLRCAAGTIREGPDQRWLARKYTAPEVPLENGLLSIEIIVEAESSADWEDDREALGNCTTSEQAEVAVSSTMLVADGSTAPSSSDIEGAELEATTLELLASPTADVPYPSAFNATTVNADGRTVTVVLGGVDMGQAWQHLADEIALTANDRLHSSRPPG